MLQSHGHVCHRVPEHGERKYGATPKPVRNGAEENCPGEESGKGCCGKSSLVSETEKSLCSNLKNPTGNQAGAHIGRLKQIIHFKEGAKRKQHNQTPNCPASRQPINASRDFCGIISSHALPLLERRNVFRIGSQLWLLENSRTTSRQLLIREFDI